MTVFLFFPWLLHVSKGDLIFDERRVLNAAVHSLSAGTQAPAAASRSATFLLDFVGTVIFCYGSPGLVTIL
jgi:hypothetical protein